ncbi:hypothetical protein [Robiginitalea sp. SC105]|uniref:hypothetical protein n=1 Tax=Robiginitalea sp. SC105 TaxID=2762332 RepID=UPI00163A9B7B|nr:hypothetical protein [Robiginitalea sp. SC105]MBC2839789.1 hypothetical protein [Robiginitalea sp. SC105]
MKKNSAPFIVFAWRLIALHTISYFAVGMLALYALDYRDLFATGALEGFMRPTDDPVTALGPGLQFIRGLIFAIVLWPFRKTFLEGNFGWFRLWLLFVGLGILATFGPAPGSVDGMIYTQIPWYQQFIFLPELLLQSLLLSIFLFIWYKKSHVAWDIVAAILMSLVMLMSAAGYLFLSQNP